MRPLVAFCQDFFWTNTLHTLLWEQLLLRGIFLSAFDFSAHNEWLLKILIVPMNGTNLTQTKGFPIAQKPCIGLLALPGACRLVPSRSVSHQEIPSFHNSFNQNFYPMKREYSKNAFWGLLLVAAFAFLGAGQLSAQSQALVANGSGNSVPSKGVYSLPQGNFVNSTLAETILLQQMEQLLGQMKANQGSPFFSALERKFNYFSTIRNEIATGKSVKEAIATGLLGAVLPMPRPSQTVISQLKQEAVNLLVI